jgi:uncharacterized membrane protein YidH (DUF202 family)
MPEPDYPDPREEDIYIGDRRVSRPDSALPDWHIPDASYRPVPIAWFAAAFMMQLVVLTILSVMLLQTSGWVTIILAGLATLALGVWTWERGMRTAGRGWQTATVLMLAVQYALVCLGAAPRL